ncbi:Sulfotransferase domain-containing protein [Roseovarius pacificus]|uniref:Sulfotransferase domain-containing protein n=1 Tax=Roseovarius pacificus TaxID=337701 RepID=A0A1M7HQ76_9RHOB|nr:sulfotransferase domain-containing protein [Roseovarius pacificus]GGO60587.1 sulfotransferase [Roseovarius pacificus]SHM30277.1 Sulfotransferase domain-containing protein [Roseovarius pacificus]
MALPDFILVGAMKCGTSTLAAQLGAQPGLFMTDPKEPNFFSDDAVFAKGQDWYESLFADAQGDIRGEASTHYTKLPTYPETLPRMRAMLDAPKIVYLIRDPVTRAVSHYIHEWTMGVMSGDIEQAFADQDELIAYGRYAMQIAPYVEAYGRENVLILSLETMKFAPQDTLERVCMFLGYDGTPEWREEQARVNASAERVRRFPMHKLVFDNPVAATLRRTLIPQSVRDRIRKSRQMQDRPALTPDLTRKLRDIYSEDFAHLRQMFPKRDDLRASYPFLTDAG